ncbi:hypothetical protein [uncultured Methylibium sp.]|uniref:hypothetical protein n=1 Tax=uncultured Methylibium sp. TaxID=381093 RepID=UPI0025FBFE01|nr:hypothetical protein [uncultured Methylibium sp.]
MSNFVVVAIDWSDKSMNVAFSGSQPGSPIEIKKCNPPCTSSVVPQLVLSIEGVAGNKVLTTVGMPNSPVVHVNGFNTKADADAWAAAHSGHFDLIHVLGP